MARTSRVDYSGIVWCVNVPSSYFVARRNGQVFITGNSGFPKASDISKTIDKRADVDSRSIDDPEGVGFMNSDNDGWNDTHNQIKMGEPTTDAAKKWDGWKTGLKPATEFVVLARKPFEGAAVDCVQEHGTGALNIDGCRIDSGERPERCRDNKGGSGNTWDRDEQLHGSVADGTTTEDRYPSNVVFDETEAERLDRQVGEVSGCKPHTVTDNGERVVLDDGGLDATGDRQEGYADSGGPSRYFYTSKASKSERTENGSIENRHPTVKPQDLMEWLVKLVTREGQMVIDPFAGSGTTCKAAKSLNRQFIGIEKQPQWADVARVRAGLTPHDPSNVRDTDDAQEGLESFGGNDDT